MSVLPNLIWRINIILIKTQAEFFRNEKTNYKTYIEIQSKYNSQNNFERDRRNWSADN